MSWIKTSDELPPENIVVETKIDDGHGIRNQTTLKRRGRLWFFPDDSMYVYYAPTHWRRRREKNMRLIDADALLKDIKGRKTRSYPKGELEWTIEQQPTIEAVLVDRNKIIDEFTKEVMYEFTVLELHDRCPTVTDCKIILRDVAEKMKGGANQ